MNYSDANSFVEKGFPFKKIDPDLHYTTVQCMSYDLANGCTILTDDASNHKVVMKVIYVDKSRNEAVEKFKHGIESCIDTTIIAAKCTYLLPKNLLFITMPYYEKGNFELLVKNTSFVGNEELYKSHFKCIANGLKSLHEHDLIHGNLKPANILSDSTNTESHLVLTDANIYQFYESPFKLKASTLFYTSPEILNNAEVTVVTDLWSFGCILYFAITGGVNLFQADTIGLLYQKISNSAHPKLPKDCPNYMKDLIDLLILNDVNRRISLDLIIEDLEEEKSKSFLIEQMEPESAVKGVLGKYENPEMTVEEMMKDLDDFKEDYESVRLIILEIAKNSDLKKKLIMEYNKSNEEQYYRVIIQLAFEAPLIKETITGKLLVQNPTELKIIKGIKEDYEWNLYFKVIEDEGIKYLLNAAHYMPYTEKLCLGSNKITVNGVKMLVERFDLFPDLSLLDIGYNPFGDEGAILIGNHLCDIPCLTDLYLSNCKIGNEGVKVISKGLLNCPDLVKIDLGSNLITDEGAKYLSVSIKSLSRLEKVNMGRNNLSNQGKSILSDCSIDKPNLTVLV